MRSALRLAVILVLSSLKLSVAIVRLRGRPDGNLSSLDDDSSEAATNGVRQHVIRLDRQCTEEDLVLCGSGKGYVICEYNEEEKHFGTKCVRQPKINLHLNLHPDNYCGSCHHCFKDSDELRKAVQDYMRNSTKHTETAHQYGWPINNWCVDHLSDFRDVFANQRKFKGVGLLESIEDWNLARATDMTGMFRSAFSFDGDLSKWNTSNVIKMESMFECAFAFQGTGVSSWDTQKVQSMSRMFRVAKAFDQDLSSWATPSLRNTSYMFYRTPKFNHPVMQDTSQLEDMSYMFAYAKNFNDSSIQEWDVSKVQTMRGAFQNTGAFAQDLSDWHPSNLQDASFLFYKASGFESSDHEGEFHDKILSNWDSSQFVSTKSVFADERAPFNTTAIAQEDATMLSHPSLDGSSIISRRGGMDPLDVSEDMVKRQL